MPRYELNLRDYQQIFQKRKFVAVVVFLCVFISVVVYTNLQSPVYRAIATVKLTERKTLGGLLTEWLTLTPGDPMISQSKVIKGRPVIERVVKELGLVGPHATAQELNNAVDFLKGCVSAEVISSTNVINIEVNYSNPEKAAAFANKIAEVYTDENLKEKNKQARTVREFIEKQLSDAEVKLKDVEDRLKNFKEKEGVTGIALSLQNKLIDLEGKKTELLRRYTPKHPDAITIDEQIESLKEELKSLPGSELEFARLTRELEIDEKSYRMLKEKYIEARITEAEKVSDVSLVDLATIPRSPIKPNRYLNYLLGIISGIIFSFASVFIVEQLDTSIGTIEDVEGFIKVPVLGVIPYLKVEGEKDIFRERLWFKRRARETKEARLLQLRAQLITRYPLNSPAVEAYRMLRTNIEIGVFKGEMKGRIVLLSSSGPQEGKSITAANLSIAMAQRGYKTLLVDADLRRSVIHRLFGLKKEPGLCDILRGSAGVEESIRTITDVLMGEFGFDEALKMPGLDNLNILSAGSIPTTPTELLSSTEMANLLTKLKEKFDIILVDTPPVLAVADPMILVPKVDAVVLVYKVGKTARTALFRTKVQIEEANRNITKGVILNNISPEVEMRYGYYYHYKYYGKYYSEEKDKEEKQKT